MNRILTSRLIVSMLLLAAFALLGAQKLSAQRWKSYRTELIVGGGISNSSTDLGGNNKASGNNLFNQDIQTIRWGSTLGLRYRFFKHFALRPTFTLGMLYGDDKYTGGIRKDRNLHFRSLVFETSVRAEFFITTDNYGFSMNFDNYRGLKSSNIISYVFFGIGLFNYNPQAKLEGVWYELQPRSTGGQSFTGIGVYKLLAVSYPMGLGVKYALNSRWYVGLELGWHFTSTDYLDDASGKYYNKLDVLYNKISPIAAKLSDRSLEYYGYDIIEEGYENAPTDKKEHELRGDPTNNDSYGFLMLTFSWAIDWRIYN